jgi:hypothetical protein
MSSVSANGTFFDMLELSETKNWQILQILPLPGVVRKPPKSVPLNPSAV